MKINSKIKKFLIYFMLETGNITKLYECIWMCDLSEITKK